MYQEAIEQAARQTDIFDFAQFSLSCPRTEFARLQPNPDMESLDAALAANYSATSVPAECPLIPQVCDSNFDNRTAMTFMSYKTLEAVFEFYWSKNRLESLSSFRSHHPGRIYGSGQYGDGRKEAIFQDFIRNADLVNATIVEMEEHYASIANQPRSQECDFDSLQDGTYVMPVEQYWDESYPYDLQEEDNRGAPEAMDCGEEDANSSAEALEPFIRGEVVSREAEEIMEREFYIDYWDRQMPQQDDYDSDEEQRRLEERWEGEGDNGGEWGHQRHVV